MALSTATNSTDSTYQLTGWNPSDTTRGSIDILWSCCITIILCCWVSTFPNAPSSSDKWYHAWVDKFNLACLGCLGPGFLFIIALGQLASARRSVIVCWVPLAVTRSKLRVQLGSPWDLTAVVLGVPRTAPWPGMDSGPWLLCRYGWLYHRQPRLQPFPGQCGAAVLSGQTRPC